MTSFHLSESPSGNLTISTEDAAGVTVCFLNGHLISDSPEDRDFFREQRVGIAKSIRTLYFTLNLEKLRRLDSWGEEQLVDLILNIVESSRSLNVEVVWGTDSAPTVGHTVQRAQALVDKPFVVVHDCLLRNARLTQAITRAEEALKSLREEVRAGLPIEHSVGAFASSSASILTESGAYSERFHHQQKE